MSAGARRLQAQDVTGVVLAGGRAIRMGGIDKGLVLLRGEALVAHALRALAPQVGASMIVANRHQDAYRVWGYPVVNDSIPDHPGPLAGMLAGLEFAKSPYVACVPCDGPALPHDLVDRLGAALLAHGAEIAVAVGDSGPDEGEAIDAAPVMRRQSVFCLLRQDLAPSLRTALLSGERKVDRWMSRHATVEVRFEAPRAFINANTLAELARLASEP